MQQNSYLMLGYLLEMSLQLVYSLGLLDKAD